MAAVQENGAAASVFFGTISEFVRDFGGLCADA